MAVGKGLKGLLIAIIVIVVIALIIGIAAIVVLNMTPNKLGFGDKAIINGESFDSLGLGDVKLINIIKQFKNIYDPDEKSIVKNGYSAGSEKPVADSNLKTGSNVSVVGGEVDYSSLITNTVEYDKEYLLTYDDKTLAYIFDRMISSSDGSNAAIKALVEMKASVKEVTITKSNGEAQFRIVMAADLKDFKAQIDEALGSVAGIIKVPDTVYMVSYLKVDNVDGNGELCLSSISLKLNDQSEGVTKAVLKVLSSQAGLSGDSEEEINKNVAEAITTVVSHLGKIGTATEINATTKEITGTANIGITGVMMNKISVITYKK
ncbi:MAG: hypothetical protein ACI4MT_03340 [Christensenellales bacterium]